MTPERWQQLKAVAADAAELDTTARAHFVARECDGDPDLRAEVESLLAHTGDRFDRAADQIGVAEWTRAEQTVIGERIGAYRILRELGRGGMGAVYLAERADREYQKEVAIKLLKRGTDTDEVLRRFRAEREILARLDHPNIARLLDGGTTADGLPYFVMEHIVGARITDYCFANNLTIAERLRLFLKVCAAVQFAHQNLVVHRDLKPSNIIVAADGEPKLLDFGIAKLLATTEASFDLTIADQQRLTPAYASPEQVRGDAITTVSDVYALGALLYELLAGAPPHRFTNARPSPTELLRVVTEIDAIRPSAATPRTAHGLRISSDLDRIVLKALRKEPSARYSGVGWLAEDIKRYLNGLPVRARAATFGYRARKFVGRNKGTVLAGTLALLALLAATGVALWNAHRAELEARRAERHFQDVRQLASSFLFEFHDAIVALPGSTAARELVVNRALDYLGRLSRESTRDRPLQLELAEAYVKVGDVQGRPYTANLGDAAGALRSYEAAAAIAQTAAEAENGSHETAARRIAVTAYTRLASVQARLKQLDDSSRHNARALEIGHRLMSDDPAHLDEWRRLVIACYWGLGDSIQAGNHQRRDPALHRAALDHYRRALTLSEQAVASNGESEDDLIMLAKSCSRAALVGELGAHTGDPALFDEAIGLHARGVGIFREIQRRHPDDAQLRRKLADASVMKASTHILANRDLDVALSECEHALEIQTALAAADRSNAEAQQDLSFAHYTTGRVLQLRGEIESAARHFRASMSILDPLVAANPDNVETSFDLERSRRGLVEATP